MMENIETLLAAVAQTQGFDDDEPEPQPSSSVPSPPVNRAPAEDPPALTPPVIGAGEKRKRGRPPKGQVVAKPPPQLPKRMRKAVEDEDEDVCFICFDGGSLVLCDRKGCPKAYHPACIKRDEAFFKSKAKWNCGWHICSVCRKSSHYLCYTCTYSLCKGCTKDADYVSVRGNKGFCSTCMKTIMLIENKDQANSESVQVDFDDKTSWEYLFKVYWVILKEKLSLTLSELTQAKKPWKGVAAVTWKPQQSTSLHHYTVNGKVPLSNTSTEQLKLNKLHIDISLPQNDSLETAVSSIDSYVERPSSNNWEDGPAQTEDTVKPSTDKVTNEPSIDKATDEPVAKEATKEPGVEKDKDNSSNVKESDKPCICKTPSNKNPDNPGIDINTEWASKDLLEFVAHMKNGDTSALLEFDVQTLLLDYIKRNNLRDPRQKSQIVCDVRLTNLFGKSRVGHIEMLKLLQYHFLIKNEDQKDSFIPAGFVGSGVGDMEVDGNNYGLSTPINSRKRKSRKKIEERATQNNLNEYAAIDVHNINLIYLRRNLMENLIEDRENFSEKVLGSIVRIRVSSNDQKQDVYRLVQVVGTSKVAEPYKIGDRTADVMLEVLNLDKKEIVSIDAISNQDFTEEECRRLRQSIRCGLVKQFTVGEVQKKAMSLQSVRVNDWLEAEILRLNHLRDRASEKGRKKELRECVDKLQLLKSPEERQRRIFEVPEIHADPKMSPDYESEEDNRIAHSTRDESVRRNYSAFRGGGRNPVSINKKGKEEGSIQTHNRMIEKTGSTAGRNDQAMQRSVLETPSTTGSLGNSPSASSIETEKLWHYRDPNFKIQGPFSMMQLRIWNTTGLFPLDMRIWTNHEQYDSVLLTDALSGQFHGASDLSVKPPSSGSSDLSVKPPSSGSSDLSVKPPSSGSGEHAGATERILEGSEGKNGDGRDNMSVLSDNNTVKTDESGSSWPKCLDLLKDNTNFSADEVQQSLGQALPDRGEETDGINNSSPNGERNSSGPTQKQLTSEAELQIQSNNSAQADPSSEENSRSLHIDLSADPVEPEPVFEPVLKSPESNKPDWDINLSNLPSPTPGTDEKQHQSIVSSDVPIHNSGILELLSPTPRTNNEDQADQTTETKQSVSMNFPASNPGPSWNNTSGNFMVGGVQQLPELGDEWCGHSPTPPKPSAEWDSGSASLKPPEIANESNPASNIPNWLSIINEPIEFDALGEESVSDLLAEVETMESQGGLPSPTSAMKFARELMQDCRDDCFSSIEDFSPTPTHDPVKSDAFSSTGLNSQSSVPYKAPIDALDSFRKPGGLHSSASSEGETNAPVYSGEAGSSEFHPSPNINTSQDMMDPGWGNVQGNINLVTVQGNVNLVLGGPGPGQGMGNLGWGASPGTAWVNSPNLNRSAVTGSLPWDGQRKYGGERYPSPREWGGYQGGGDPGFGRGRPPWGRQSYGGGRPKGQRVCKFYESGHCKKGAFCDYLHP